MSAPSKLRLQIYDSWDLAKPKTSPRSRLYHLKPFGVGTARTESCTSYIARLAKEHCVSVHSLFTRELALASKKPSLLRGKSKFLSSGKYGQRTALNGRGHTARYWVEVLERLTLQQGLSFLTMLPWQNVLPDKYLLRAVRAWCPWCLEEQCDLEAVVYEHLLWTLAPVNICPHHQRRLETICPHCHNQVLTLGYTSRPGHCSQCHEWLGHSDSKKEMDVSPLTTEEFQYQLWVANQMSTLIAVAPELRSDQARERVKDFIVTSPKRISDGNVSDFARLVGVIPATFHRWQSATVLPRADLLLKMCYRLGVSFSDLLTKDEVFPDLELISHSPVQEPSMQSRIRDKNGVVRRQLLAALQENPSPSVREVAQYLGYAQQTSIYRGYPDLCKMLTARRRRSYRPQNRIPPPEKNRHDVAAFKRTLQQALKQRVPPSLNEIGKRLGYASAGPLLRMFPNLCEAINSRRARPQVQPALQQALEEKVPPPLNQLAKRLGYVHASPFRAKFPDLCKAITARRAECRKQHRKKVRLMIEAILLEDPPPTLKEASRRLGYKSNCSLARYHPELSRSLAPRHAEYRKAQFKGIRHKLKDAIHEEPPPSFRAVAKRLGYTRNYLSMKFPAEGRTIDKRHSLFRKRNSLKKKRQTMTRVRLLALDLHANGEYPSPKRLMKYSHGPLGLSTSELCTLLRDVRRELGLFRA